MLTPDQLDQIKQRAEALPREEWTADGQRGKPGHCAMAQVFGPEQSRMVIDPTEDPAEATAIAEFIAHARTDIPALLAYVARLEAVAHQMAGVLRAYEAWHGEVVLDATCWANDDGALVHGRHLDRLIEIQDERNAALANYASEGGRHDD